MLISFLGSPLSGKTTVAARVFSELKDSGVSTEFITEKARHFIAKYRRDFNLKPTDNIKLTDLDQLDIQNQQLQIEELMKESCGEEVVIVSDSSALNSLLYMTPEARNKYEIKQNINKANKLYDIIFLCHPVTSIKISDPNRIHSPEESLKIHKQINDIINLNAPEVKNKIIEIYGDRQFRLSECLRIITNYLIHPSLAFNN